MPSNTFIKIRRENILSEVCGMLKTKVDEVSKIFENFKAFIEFKFKL